VVQRTGETLHNSDRKGLFIEIDQIREIFPNFLDRGPATGENRGNLRDFLICFLSRCL